MLETYTERRATLICSKCGDKEITTTYHQQDGYSICHKCGHVWIEEQSTEYKYPYYFGSPRPKLLKICKRARLYLESEKITHGCDKAKIDALFNDIFARVRQIFNNAIQEEWVKIDAEEFKELRDCMYQVVESELLEMVQQLLMEKFNQ